MASTSSLKTFIFRVRHGFLGYPRQIDSRKYRFDESLRRWDFEGEEQVRRVFRSELSAGDTAVDIGSNFGMHTLIMADVVGSTGRVIAVEPVAENLRLLRRNIQLNGYGRRVSVYQTAISDRPEKKLRMAVETTGLEPSASLLPGASQSESIEVDNISLDSLLSDQVPFGKGLIKIDVEGAELSVLRSGLNLLSSARPKLLIEVHQYALPTFGGSVAELYEFLESCRYTINRISDMQNHNGEYHHILALPA